MCSSKLWSRLFWTARRESSSRLVGQAFLHVCVLYQEVWDSRFALKVARDVEFGFAARSEAVAMPRRKQLPPFRAAPLVWG